MLEGAKPTELHDRFLEWKQLIGPHRYYVLPVPGRPQWAHNPDAALGERWDTQALNQPDLPFADWDAEVPPPPALLIIQLLNEGAMDLPIRIEQLSQERAGCGRDKPSGKEGLGGGTRGTGTDSSRW